MVAYLMHYKVGFFTTALVMYLLYSTRSFFPWSDYTKVTSLQLWCVIRPPKIYKQEQWERQGKKAAALKVPPPYLVDGMRPALVPRLLSLETQTHRVLRELCSAKHS